MDQVTNRSHGYTDAQLEQATGRCGDWMQTFTGLAFWPLDPRSEDVCVEDIAHGLSLVCRFAGQCQFFYSVAEHSWLVASQVPPEFRLQALLHDATEAYIGDMVRPLKQGLPQYRQIEADIWGAIAQRFDVPFQLAPCVKAADNRVLLAERDCLLRKPPIPWYWSKGLTPAPVSIVCLSPRAAEAEFLAAFKEYTA